MFADIANNKVKESKIIDSVDKTLKQIKDFSTELNDNKGYVIIEYKNVDLNNLALLNIVVEII